MGGAVELWDTTTGKRLAILKEDIGRATALEFSVDGTTLVCASWTKKIEYSMWEIATGREMLRFTKKQDITRVNKGTLVLSQNPHLVASGHLRTVKIWDVVTEELRHTLIGDRYIEALAFSPDGKTLAGGGKEIRLWDTEIGNELSKLDGHTSTVRAITFASNSRILASGGFGGEIILWNLDTPNQKSTLPHLLRFATGGEQAKIKSKYNTHTLTGHTLPIEALDFTTDIKKLASGSQDGTVIVWDVETGNPLFTLTGHAGGIKGLKLLQDDETLISGGDDGAIRLWDIDTRTEQLTQIRLPRFDTVLTFSRDGKTIGVGNYSQVQLENTDTQNSSIPLIGHRDIVMAVAFSPDDKFFAMGGRKGKVVLWNLPNYQHPSTYDAHTDEINAVVFSPDSKTLASASKDGTVQLLDLHTEEKTTLGTKPNSSVEALAFSPDSSTLVSAHRNRTIQLWDTNTHQHIADFIDAKRTTGLAFSPDGKTVISGANGGLIQLWDVDARAVRQEIWTGDAAAPTKFAFTWDGKTLLSSSQDGTILIWDLDQ